MSIKLPTTAQLKGIRFKSTPARVWLNGQRLDLAESLQHANHSPTGFEWGYGGSGPTQLAFEICRQLYGSIIAAQVKADFRRRFLEAITADRFDLTLDLEPFNAYCVRPLLDDEPMILDEDDEGDEDGIYTTDNGPTGHGNFCYSDADPGL